MVTEGTGATHVGQRKHNEDAYLMDPAHRLAIVADGVGGHQAGEVASAITCEVIQREVAAGRSIEDGIRAANREVMAAVAQGRGKAGMASTVVVAQFNDTDYEVAWVGDSRAYLWDGQLKLLTRDHSYVQALLAKGQISLAQARNHPRKNVIVQAIGLQDDDKLQVGVNCGRLEPGQVLLLCSDGLSDVLDSAALVDILSAEDSLEARCDRLVSAAVEVGGRDNITVILLPGAQSTSGAALLEPELLWSYNPATGEYSGLPELEEIEVDSSSATPIPAVRRVAPRATGGKGPQLESTQMMSVDEMEKARREVQRGQEQGRNRRIYIAIAAVLVVASVVYSVGILYLG